MSLPNPESARPLSPIRPRRSRWFRAARGLGFGLLALLTLAGLLIAIENWRAARDWAAYESAAAARGESLRFAAPAPVVSADPDNLAVTPLLRPLLDYRRRGPGDPAPAPGQPPADAGVIWADPAGVARARALALPSPTNGTGRLPDGRADFPAWAAVLRSPGAGPSTDPAPVLVLRGLTRHEAALAELDAATRRSQARFAVHWDENFGALVPHLEVLKAAQTMVRLRTTARLAAGDPAGAYADAQFGLRLADALRTEPLMISQLVRLAQRGVAVGAIWDGLADHRWNEEQLRFFQSALAAVDLAPSGDLAVQGERGIVNEMFERWVADPRRAGAEMVALGEGAESTPAGPFPVAWPRAVFRRNQLQLNRLYQGFLDAARRPASKAGVFPGIRIDLTGSAVRSTDLAAGGRSPYDVFARMLAPAFESFALRFNKSQVQAHLAATACALERFRLRHGGYPEALAGLVPDFLPAVPADLMDGAPLRYQRTGDGWFRLYSVGDNGQDDGGVGTTDGRAGAKHLDWLWPRPVAGASRWF